MLFFLKVNRHFVAVCSSNSSAYSNRFYVAQFQELKSKFYMILFFYQYDKIYQYWSVGNISLKCNLFKIVIRQIFVYLIIIYLSFFQFSFISLCRTVCIGRVIASYHGVKMQLPVLFIKSSKVNITVTWKLPHYCFEIVCDIRVFQYCMWKDWGSKVRNSEMR